MAGLVQRLPFPLSGRTGKASARYGLSGVSYDYAIGGMPFLSAINNERVLTRSGVPNRKEQFDNQEIPGEQSLANWWLRSQSTFIGGAGLLYQDPSVDNAYAIRYGESQGVNPWVNGKVTLLRSTAQDSVSAGTDPQLVLGYHDGADRYWHASGAVLNSCDGTTPVAVTWGGAGIILSLASDGTNYYAADATGVYKGAAAGAGALAWNTGSATAEVAWVKGRLMAGIGPSVYELVGAGAPALPTAKYTHLNTAWTWTSFAEGPDSIYAAGYAGSVSGIYRFVLDGSGEVPVLTGGVVTAQLPHGEQVLSMTAYLGTFVGIGTSRGFRVGQINASGDIEYGPLIFEIDGGVSAIGAFDRFFFVAATNSIEGESGLYRVDLGQPLQAGGQITPAVTFAYATDLQAHVTGAVTGVTNFGNSDRMVFAVTGSGAYLESASELEATGTLSSGRVRFNTLEPKIFKFLSVRTETLQGSVAASVIDPGGGDTSVITISEGSGLSIDNVIMTAPGEPAEWVQIKLTMTRSSTDTTQGATITGWQLKAMPGAIRQRLVTMPLLCFDKEQDRFGNWVGREGRSASRLQAFEQLFQAGDSVTYQDLATKESVLVVIDNYRYEQGNPPGTNKAGTGGVLWVEMRTIADVIA